MYYATGRITHTIAATKSGANFLAFLIALVAAYARRKVRLVCDNGRFHHTKAVAQWLAAHRGQVEVYWLPPYCPSLNLIERLWGHLKRTVLANVLFRTMDDLVAAFRRGVIRTAPRQLQTAMAGVILAHRKNTPITSSAAYDAYCAFCERVGLRALTYRAFSDFIAELDMYSLIRCRVISKGRYGRTREVSVELPEETLARIYNAVVMSFQLRD